MFSILIPTAGRGEVLPVVLESAHRECRAIGHPTEVIVIDNNTDEVLVHCIRQQCDAAEGPVRYVREPSPGLSAARHRGADEAAGEWLVFLDDDVELGQGWLAGMLEGFTDRSVGIVGGPSIPRFGGSVPAWFWDFVTPTPYGGWHCTWVSLLDIGRPVDDIHPNYVWGLNFGIRRSVLKELGGFHPDLVPGRLQRWQGDGETGLTLKAQAAGVKARYVPQALLYHYVGPERLTVDYFVRRARYQGVCDSFTQIRATGALVRTSPAAPAQAAAQSTRTWESAAADVHRLTAQAYREGFEFHQREAANDPRLLQWIHRETFWGADILAEAEAVNGPV
ncbi:MAG: glycosyltransferase family 2 protein [Lysobacterales bacterium]|nr:MAG: glycosyltransferase family 2 protein [Xanthomonadales bacterium]